MEVEQGTNLSNRGMTPNGDAADGVTMSVPAGSMAQPAKSGAQKGMIVGLVCLALVALAGCAFGAYGMITKEDEVAKAKAMCISSNDDEGEEDESAQVATCTDDGESVAASNAYKNPVIQSDDEYVYSLYFISSDVPVNGVSSADGKMDLMVYLTDGEVSGCRRGSTSDCSISGFPGKIYKTIEFGSGHDNSYNNIGFIMEDGTVWYFPLFDIVEGQEYVVKKLNIDGFVRDAIDVNVNPVDGMGGFGSTLFVLGDGSYVPFSESMIE